MLPIKLYRNEQIRAFDRLAIEQGIPSFKLMTRAGHALFRHIQHHHNKARSFAVFCGSGNNSGDGYIVARLLHRENFKVCVYTVAEPEQLRGDALTAYHHYALENGAIKAFDVNETIDADVIIDALFGLGLTRPIEGVYADAVEKINQHDGVVVAIDIPSGLNADTGMVMGCAVKANATVTFIGMPQGLLTGEAADYCGDIVYDPLDIPQSVLATQKPSAVRVVHQKLPRRLRCSHKGTYGHVLIVGGDQGYTGAARLAGEAALRCGAGLVSIATRHAHAALLNVHRPELMCHGVETAETLKPLLEKASVVAIGTGLGQHTWAKTLLTATLHSQKTLIVDADALNLLARQPQKRDNWILTPHPAEAARLLNISTKEVQQDRFAAVSALQQQYGGVVVLKGNGSLIASNGRIALSNTGNAGMASGGMGDVLTGTIAALVAQGLDLVQAAEQGVYLHGKAADDAARHGERGLIASDLFAYLRMGVNE